MNATKKQNRILVITLSVLLAAVIGLIALTSGANRKASSEKNDPPLEPSLDTKVEETVEGNAKSARSTAKNEVTEDGAKEQKPENGSKMTAGDASKEEEQAEEVSATVHAEDMLPVFRAPVDGVVVKSCSLTVPVFSSTMNDYRTHGGLDFAAAPGTPVLAAASGVVTEVRKDPMMGVTVTVQHSGGAETKYQGLSEDSMGVCVPGEQIAQGQLIGAAGETALIESAEENHVHFEMAVKGKRVDPADYMDVVMLSELYEDGENK